MRSRRAAWAVLAGVMLAFMHATKETFVIPLAAMVGAFLLTALLTRRGSEEEHVQGTPLRLDCPSSPPDAFLFKLWHLKVALLAAAVLSAVLFSCGFRNPRGIVDSVLTFQAYLGRGAGHSTAHIHPWYYYLQILGWYKLDKGPLWTEAFILLLGVVGLGAALARLWGLTWGVCRRIITVLRCIRDEGKRLERGFAATAQRPGRNAQF